MTLLHPAYPPYSRAKEMDAGKHRASILTLRALLGCVWPSQGQCESGLLGNR